MEGTPLQPMTDLNADIDIPEVYTGPAADVGAEDVDVAPTVDDAPTVGGQGAETVPDDAQDLIDLDEIGDKYVTVKVQGEEMRVPVRELANGYMRQADYTRKTQELALGRAIQEGLSKNPAETIAWLQQQFGVAEAQRLVDANQPDEWGDETFDDLTPEERVALEVERRVAERIAPLERAEAARHLQSVVQTLQQRYENAPIPFDPKAVAQEAIRRGLTHPDYLEPIYLEMVGRQMVARSQAEAQRQAEEAAQKAQAEAAKAGIVSHSNGSMPAVADAPSQPRTFREAALAAAAELGIDLGAY